MDKLQAIIIGFLLFVCIYPVSAMKPIDSYEDEQCELIAKDYRAEFGGDLIFIQPLKDNGAYDLGDFNGHWLNKAWNIELGSYYFDYKTGSYLFSIQDIKDWYKYWTNKDSEVFNVNQEVVPFALNYYY